MVEVRRTETFRKWFASLRDVTGKVAIARRIERFEAGNFGDASPVGEGVKEMRVHVGPGYRVYFVIRGSTLVILLCGGDKGSQRRDIEAAKLLAMEE